MSSELLRRARKAFEQRVAELGEACGEGTCSDFASYRYVVGQIKGLRTAQDLITETLERMNEEEDDD